MKSHSYQWIHCHGQDVTPYIAELAALRIQVFRDYPYLYDGSVQYEANYLQRYAKAKHSIVSLCQYQGQIVGATTGMPLVEEELEFFDLYKKHGFKPEEIFYFGESVLLKEHRGHGAGRLFMKFREEQARRCNGIRYSSFCAVMRPDDHPLRPAHYRGLEMFWRNLGYQPIPGMIGALSWRDLGEDSESEKPMQFWLRSLY